MKQFEISSKFQTVLIGLMILGVVSMGATWMVDDALHSRFWSNFLHNALFFTGISFIALFALSAFITAYAGWFSVFKRLWEAYSMFLIVGIVLMGFLAVGVFLGWHHLYHWADADSVKHDKVLQGKSAFLNPLWYAIATFLFLGLSYFIAKKIRNLSLAEDNSSILDFSHYKKTKFWAAIYLPVFGFLGPVAIWQWIMSVDAHWYSTLYAWYCFASLFVAMIALSILLIIYFKSRGYFEEITTEHLHDLGKFLFAFSIFWTYLWFSQYMLIWYSNNGEETVYYHVRQKEYPLLFWANLALNFVVPFLILLRNDTKRKVGTLVFTAALLVFTHWLDFFLMVKPGVLHTAHELSAGHGNGHSVEHGAAHASSFVSGFTMPGFLEIGWFLGFLALFLFIALRALASAPLIARRDPYIGESLHHHV